MSEKIKSTRPAILKKKLLALQKLMKVNVGTFDDAKKAKILKQIDNIRGTLEKHANKKDLNRIKKTKETAAPLPDSAYTWYTYNGERGTNITSTNGKRTVKLVKGSDFGVRAATSGKLMRLITNELGPTIVFTLSSAKTDLLIHKSKGPFQGKLLHGQIRLSKKRGPKSKKEAEVIPVIPPAAKKLYKAPELDLTTGSIDWLAGLRTITKKTTNTAMGKAAAYMLTRPKKGKKLAKTHANGSDQGLRQAQKYLKKFYTDFVGSNQNGLGFELHLDNVYIDDAFDILKLSIAAANNDTKFAGRQSYDTNIREDMGMKLYTWYNKVRW